MHSGYYAWHLHDVRGVPADEDVIFNQSQHEIRETCPYKDKRWRRVRRLICISVVWNRRQFFQLVGLNGLIEVIFVGWFWFISQEEVSKSLRIRETVVTVSRHVWFPKCRLSLVEHVRFSAAICWALVTVVWTICSVTTLKGLSETRKPRC